MCRFIANKSNILMQAGKNLSMVFTLVANKDLTTNYKNYTNFTKPSAVEGKSKNW